MGRSFSCKGVLAPPRADLGKLSKLDDALQEQIKYLKTNYPSISASAIYRQLCDNGSIKPGELSESTVNRYLHLLARETKTTTNQDMHRYERPHINEVWCGDSSVGPYLKAEDGKKHKVYVIALMSVMKSAVAKFGRPQLFNFDNGSSYK